MGPDFVDRNMTGILGTIVDGYICGMILALYREMHFQCDGDLPAVTSEAKPWFDVASLENGLDARATYCGRPDPRT